MGDDFDEQQRQMDDDDNDRRVVAAGEEPGEEPGRGSELQPGAAEAAAEAAAATAVGAAAAVSLKVTLALALELRMELLRTDARSITVPASEPPLGSSTMTCEPTAIGGAAAWLGSRCMLLIAHHDMASEIGWPSRSQLGCTGAWLDSERLTDSEWSEKLSRWRGTVAIIFSTTLPCSVV